MSERRQPGRAGRPLLSAAQAVHARSVLKRSRPIDGLNEELRSVTGVLPQNC